MWFGLHLYEEYHMDQLKSRRQFLRSMAFAGGAALVAACGAAAVAEPTAAPVDPTAAPVEPTSAPAVVATVASTVDITYWGSFSGALGEAEKTMVDTFNASQSDVKVTLEFQGNYEETAQKLTAAIQAKKTPDVSLMSDVWWFKFYLAGALQPLKDLMAAQQVDASDYADSLINEGTRKGDIHWVPFARSTPLFYYNKDIFAEVGLPDRGPETWAEFAEWAPKLVKMDGSTMARAAFAHPNSASYVAWLFQGVIWQHSGRYSDPDFTIRIQEENGVRAGKFYQDSVLTGKWASNAKDIGADFLGGLTAATIASTGGLAGFEKNANSPFPSHKRRSFDSRKMASRYPHKLGGKARHSGDRSTGIERGSLIFLNFVLKHPADGVFREILLVKFCQHFVAGIHFLNRAGRGYHRGIIDHGIHQRFGRGQVQGLGVCD
jgi:sn-glycerol 3-phosphate transport system substrate-binding protein